MNFPESKEEFDDLRKNNKNVEYSETNSESEVPEGDNWEFWSTRKNDTEEKAIWRRIITATKLVQ